MPNTDDMDGRKPYKTYKAGRARRSPVDDELAGARPPRRGPDDLPADAHPGGGYRRYGAPKAGGARGKNAAKAASAGAEAGRRRRFRWWYIPVGALLVLVIAAVVVTVLAWPGYKKFDQAVAKANARLDSKTRAQLSPDSGWIWRNGTTLLLLGVDSKHGEPARSDTIMLMRFNPKTHTINELSIPRDTRVMVAGQGYTKINEAMFWGWPSAALAVATVKQYTGIPINHVMIVNFKGFPRLVNAVGGVDMMVPKTIETQATRTAAWWCSRRACTTSTASTPCSTCASVTSTSDFHPRGTPAGLRAGAGEEDRTDFQHHQAARDRQALHERRGHRPHHQPDPRARLPQVARHGGFQSGDGGRHGLHRRRLLRAAAVGRRRGRRMIKKFLTN